MLEKLKEEVYKANMDLPNRTCYIYMGKCKRNRQRIRTFVIKPSGLIMICLTPDDMVVVDLNGNKVEGKYNPSSDTATHVELYKAFPNIGGVVHTTLFMGNKLGTGRKIDPMLWNHTCRLYLW